MKNIFLTIAVLLFLATSAQAKKTLIEFCPGVEGYISNPNALYLVERTAITNEEWEIDYNTCITILNTSSKDTVTFTKIDPDDSCYLSIQCGSLKSLVYKGKKSAYISDISIYSENLTVKLPKVSIDSLFCNSLKTAQVGSVWGVYQDTDYEKGSVLKATDFVSGEIYGCYKSITSGDFGYVEGFSITTPKTLVLKSKTPGGLFLLNPNVQYKAKNVNITNVPLDSE